MRRLMLGLVVCVILFSMVNPVMAQANRRVFYGGSQEEGVQTALSLAGYTLVTDPAQADVFVLNGEVGDANTIAARVKAGAGLVLILGESTTPANVETLLGIPVQMIRRTEAVSLTEVSTLADPLVSEVIWNGAPQVRERYEIVSPLAAAQPVVTAYEDGSWILWRAAGNLYVFNAFLNDANPQIQEWAYFNYLIYHLVERAAGAQPQSFADYPASPVPHEAERNGLFLFLAVMLVFTYTIFGVVRRYSRQHPEALDSLIGNQARFETQENGSPWEQAGFHRPLSGLLVGMSLGIVLFIPLIIYQNLILPQFILPSAQAMGIWGRVTQFFGLTWVIFDMGTAAASMKFMAQYRVSNPRRGIQYLQVYVWWQALSGAAQIALVVALASTGVVRSPYALYAWSIIVHCMIQLPGFYQVMRNTLNSLQRNDYARYMDTAYAIVLPMITQPILVPLFYAWGKAHPEIGGALGGVLGMGAAAYALELSVFLIGLWLYRRIGYKASVLFMAHFDWGVVREAFRFGFFEMLGGTVAAGGVAAEIWITQTGLINYTEVWGNWMMAQNFVFAFTVCTNLFDGVMPAISEALSNGRKLLSQYYSVQSYKWGALASAFLLAVLLVAAPRFIIGSAGSEFQRAALYAVPLILWGAIQYPAWLGDSIFLGANRPFLRAILIAAEQITRVSLGLILLARFQIIALVIAYFIALLGRGIASYFLSHKVCFPQRFYFWQSIAAPVLAAGAHFGLMSLVASLIWQGDELTSMLLFFIGLLPSLPFYMFFYALFGGWDVDTLAELKEAIELTGFLRKFAYVMFYIPSQWGAKISPLHNRFPITIRAAALAEAHSLTIEKVSLV